MVLPSFPLTFPVGEDKLEISIGRPEEDDEVLDFMKENFYMKPPNRPILEYDETPEAAKGYYSRALNNFRKYLSDGTSLMVRNKSTGKLVAAALNKLEDIGTPVISNDYNRLYVAILVSLHEGYDIYSMNNVDRVLRFSITSVSKPYQRFGLATKLFELSIDLAKVHGAGAIKVEAMSEYATRALIKLGFTVVKSIDYATYEYNGTRPLLALADQLDGHCTARLMTLRLP